MQPISVGGTLFRWSWVGGRAKVRELEKLEWRADAGGCAWFERSISSCKLLKYLCVNKIRPIEDGFCAQTQYFGL